MSFDDTELPHLVEMFFQVKKKLEDFVIGQGYLDRSRKVREK